MALPLLSDRGVSHGALHLSGGGRNACLAGLACSGRVPGCNTDFLAFSLPSPGRFGESGMGGGGLGSDANRGSPEGSPTFSDEAHPLERFAVSDFESSLPVVRWRGDTVVQTAVFMPSRINSSSVESAIPAWRCLRSGLLRRLPFSFFGTVGTRPQLEFMGWRVPSLVVM
jgi:hypothetical protein